MAVHEWKQIRNKICRKCRKIVVSINKHGLCIDCSMKFMRDHVMSMHRKKGAGYDRWKEGMRIFLDEELGK